MRPDLLATIERRHHIHVSDGLQVAGPSALAARPIDPTWPLLVLPEDGEPGPTALAALADGEFRPLGLPGRGAHPTAALPLLRSLYPADHPALAVAEASDTTVGRLTEADLAAEAWLLPALAPAAATLSPFALPWLVARLRAPDGCPWDREQTHQSLRKHLLEEAYEVYDALEDGSTPALADELGDLLLQVVLHAQYGAEAGVFDLADVQAAIGAKIVRRHPHVFGEAHVESVGDVLRKWETIKAAERAGVTVEPCGAGATRGCRPRSPACRARCPPWPTPRRCRSGRRPSATTGATSRASSTRWGRRPRELLAAEGPAERAEEFGDLLLVLVNLARRLGVDAEAALRGASAKFAARFAHVERLADARQVLLRDLSLDELDELWVIAKRAIAEDDREHPGQGRSEDPHEHRRHTLPGRRTPAGTAASRVDDARRPEVGRGIVPHPDGRHARPVRGDHRGPHPAAPARQGHGLGHRRVQHAAAGDRRADAAGGRQGRARRSDARDPAPHRPVAARGRGHGPPRRAHGDGRLRRDPGRRRHADGLDHRRLRGARPGPPLTRPGAAAVGQVAAVSVGIVDGTACLDLDYAEDSHAQVDLNVVGTDGGAYVELQGTAEGKPFDRAALERLLGLADEGLQTLFEAQRQALVKPAA